MEDFIKNIIVEKRFFELTPKEKLMIKDWAENEEEFDALKLTFLSTASFNLEKQVQLSSSVKKRLKDRFAAKHVHQKEIWLNKVLLFFFPRDKQFFKKPAFQLVIVAITVALVIPLFWQKETPQYAMIDDADQLELDTIKSLQKESKIKINEAVDQDLLKEQPIEKRVADNKLKDNSSVTSTELTSPTINNDQPNLTFNHIDNQVEDLYKDETIEIQSSKRAKTEIQLLEEMGKIQFSRNDVAMDYKKPIPEKVDVSETIGLLTALF